jgi:hypothetical protein
MSRRSLPLRRRKAQLSPKPRILIVCEGELTEPSYFEGLKRLTEVHRLVNVIVDPAGAVPKTLVERAVAEKKKAQRKARAAQDDSFKYDEVWCVFDIDEHPNVPEAKQQAQAHGIALAISNPCFELWLLLHFADQRGYIHRHDVQAECRKYLKDYEKNVDFEQVRSRIDDAVKRATDLAHWQSSRGCAGQNPSTTVHQLIIRIRSLGKAEPLKQIRDLQTKSGYRSSAASR